MRDVALQGRTLPLPVGDTARALARVAITNPDAVRLAAQLLGVPACPKCDYVMRPGHVCRGSEPLVRQRPKEER